MAKTKTKTAGKGAEIAEWMYEIVQRPHITEKATMGSQHSQVSFQVPGWASKPQVKEAVETLFKVKVKGVNSIVLKGKTKMFRGRPGVRSDLKKVIVTLEEGQTIDVGATL